MKFVLQTYSTVFAYQFFTNTENCQYWNQGLFCMLTKTFSNKMLLPMRIELDFFRASVYATLDISKDSDANIANFI